MTPLICLLQVICALACSSIILGAVAELELALTCPDNTTSELFSRRTPTGTIIGIVNSDLVAITIRAVQTGEFGSLYLNTSGSYFLPSPVDGKLTRISVFGLIEEEILRLELGVEDITEAFARPIPTQLQRNAYMYAVVYGQSSNGMEYHLISGPTLISHALSAMSVNLDVSIRKGDLIGLLLPSVCIDGVSTITLCPSRPNLPSRDDKCSSAFFHPMDSAEMVLDSIPTSEFTEVLVNLSMAAEIVPLPGNNHVIIGVGTTVAIIIINGVVVTSILVVLRYRSAKKSKNKASKSADDRCAQSIPFSTLDAVHFGKNLTCTRGEDTAQVNTGLVRNLSQLNLVIPATHITLADTIGQGEFGVVYKGHLSEWQGRTKPELVAIKTLKNISGRDINNLLTEGEKMIKFDHLHILSLLGVCVDTGEAPCIIMPYMANGSLLVYLRKMRSEFTIAQNAGKEKISDVTRKLLSICLQIAKGMCYLAEKKFVHRDLAARNCMISEDFVIKVADFGLAEDIYCCDYFRQGQESEEAVKLPVKWMALESLLDSIFTEKTDVWSYGVTCWEVFSLGHTPYPTVHPLYLVKYLEDGGRLTKPSNAACKDQVYTFIHQCWIKAPDMRPTFQEVTEALDALLEEC